MLPDAAAACWPFRPIAAFSDGVDGRPAVTLPVDDLAAAAVPASTLPVDDLDGAATGGVCTLPVPAVTLPVDDLEVVADLLGVAARAGCGVGAGAEALLG